ncbi:XK-related protein 6-like [Mercenaria mercenaria]|uniref:XK-related protein 6-like n=1 Tax=Mercenaria mercenaria TaxID=6596 RepID=UPI00234E4BFA|nr:XK-related protein 6-like [Mercenaria mercenaria]
MASKKKLPHSRRCKYSEEVAAYCYCPTDEGDVPLKHCDKTCCEGTDSPDLIQVQSRTSSQNSGIDKYVSPDEPLPDFEHKERRKRQIPPHDGHSETEVLHVGPDFTCFDVLVGLSSIAFFYFDVVTDILLARDYFHQGNMLAFALTAAFIIGPSLITCMLNFRWYLLDYQSQQLLVKNYGKENVQQTSMFLWLTRFALTLLMMGPVIRQIEYIYNGLKSSSKYLPPKEKKRHYIVMRMEDVDACCIRMFECFLEAAPQLVLQIYILMLHRQQESWILEGIRAAAILSSWASLSWSMVAYQKALRFSHEDKENMTIPGMIFSFLWRACEIGPRVISLGLFAALFDYFVFIIVGLHWIAMSSWLFCQKTQFYQNRCEERCFNIVCGYVLVFCFLNVRDGATRYRMLVYYFIIYAENFTMMGFWFYFTEDKSQWFYIPTFFVVSLGAILQLFFQLTYYGCFHPLGRGSIPCCLKGQEYSCYQSLCHELDPDEIGYIENPHTTNV